MKKLITSALSLLFVACTSYTAIAGILDSPGAPSAGSGMYTLQNLYDYLTSGAALTVQSSFQEPLSGPTAGTMKSTKEIGDAIKSLHDQCDATADDVALGKKFFCTQLGSWGIQTGRVCIAGTPTPTPTITLTPTITPTSTITPTATPSWGSTQCLAKDGYWGSKNDGTGDYGCWFFGSGDETCIATCTRESLSCDSGTWNDNSSCANCQGMLAQGSHTMTSCQGGLDSYPVPVMKYNEMCFYRPVGTPMPSCAVSSGHSVHNRLCVCQP